MKLSKDVQIAHQKSELTFTKCNITWPWQPAHSSQEGGQTDYVPCRIETSLLWFLGAQSMGHDPLNKHILLLPSADAQHCCLFHVSQESLSLLAPLVAPTQHGPSAAAYYQIHDCGKCWWEQKQSGLRGISHMSSSVPNADQGPDCICSQRSYLCKQCVRLETPLKMLMFFPI